MHTLVEAEGRQILDHQRISVTHATRSVRLHRLIIFHLRFRRLYDCRSCPPAEVRGLDRGMRGHGGGIGWHPDRVLERSIDESNETVASIPVVTRIALKPN